MLLFDVDKSRHTTVGRVPLTSTLKYPNYFAINSKLIRHFEYGKVDKFRVRTLCQKHAIPVPSLVLPIALKYS